jgi:hypothetical protein
MATALPTGRDEMTLFRNSETGLPFMYDRLGA